MDAESIIAIIGGSTVIGGLVRHYGEGVVDRLLRRNGKKEELSSTEKAIEEFIAVLDNKLLDDVHMTRETHDRECDLKLKPIWKKLDDMHTDIKDIKKNGKSK